MLLCRARTCALCRARPGHVAIQAGLVSSQKNRVLCRTNGPHAFWISIVDALSSLISSVISVDAVRLVRKKKKQGHGFAGKTKVTNLKPVAKIFVCIHDGILLRTKSHHHLDGNLVGNAMANGQASVQLQAIPSLLEFTRMTPVANLADNMIGVIKSSFAISYKFL